MRIGPVVRKINIKSWLTKAALNWYDCWNLYQLAQSGHQEAMRFLKSFDYRHLDSENTEFLEQLVSAGNPFVHLQLAKNPNWLLKRSLESKADKSLLALWTIQNQRLDNSLRMMLDNSVSFGAVADAAKFGHAGALMALRRLKPEDVEPLAESDGESYIFKTLVQFGNRAAFPRFTELYEADPEYYRDFLKELADGGHPQAIEFLQSKQKPGSEESK